MNKQSLAYLLTLMVALSGMTYYTFNNHTTFIKDAEESDIYSKWFFFYFQKIEQKFVFFFYKFRIAWQT